MAEVIFGATSFGFYDSSIVALWLFFHLLQYLTLDRLEQFSLSRTTLWIGLKRPIGLSR